MNGKRHSKKLWVLISTAVITLVGEKFGLGEEIINRLIDLATYYFIGQGVGDVGKAIWDKTKNAA